MGAKGILGTGVREVTEYSDEQLAQVLRNDQPKNRINLGYAYVDSPHQQDDLLREEQLIESYLALQGKPLSNHHGYRRWHQRQEARMETIALHHHHNQAETIYVLRKKRLLRFDFELLEEVCRLHDTKIEIIHQSEEETSEKEFVEEMIKKPPASRLLNSKLLTSAEIRGNLRPKRIKRLLDLQNRL